MEDHPWKREGKTASWREKADREKRERVQRAILNGSLTIRYIDRGTDPYKSNGNRREQVVVNTNETWAERTLREAQEQKPRLLDLIQRTEKELAAIEAIEAALSSLEGIEGDEITTPLAESVSPPAPTPRTREPATVDVADISDEEVVAAFKKLGQGTDGWVSTGPVKRELRSDDPNFGAKKVVPLVKSGVLQKKGAGARTMYRVKGEKPTSRPDPITAPPEKKKTGPGQGFKHPGPEALPEHLREMPAASANMNLTQKTKAAETQFTVYEDINNNPPSVSPEVAERVGFPLSRTRDALDALEEAGLIRLTSEWRRAHGQAAGRTAKEYASLESEAEVSPKEEEELEVSEEESVSAPEPEITQQDHPTLEEVRDATAKQPDSFSAGNIAKMNDEWTLEVTTMRLDALAEVGILERIQILDDVVVYNYIYPDEPGAAALMDQARSKEQTEHGPGSVPVPGTAKLSLPSHKDAAETVKSVRRAGLEAKAVSSGHWAITDPNSSKRMMIAGTPSNPKTIESDRKRLRRMFNIHI